MSYVYEQLNTNAIARALSQDEYAGWSKDYDASLALAEYIENLAIDQGEPIELDIVALRCDFSVYDSIAEFQKEYGAEYSTFDAIQDATTLIMIDDERFIARGF